MLPDAMVRASLMTLLAWFAPLFTVPSFRTFTGLACGFLGQFAGGGLLPGQVGDGVDGLGRPPPRALGTAAPGDPQHLAGVREQQVVDGDGLQLAVLLTAVADVVAAVHHRDLVTGPGSQL